MTQMTRIATATADVILMRCLRVAARSKLNGKFAKAIDENSLTRAATYKCVGRNFFLQGTLERRTKTMQKSC